MGYNLLAVVVSEERVLCGGGKKDVRTGRMVLYWFLGDGTRVVGFLARYWLVVTVKGSP